jgi:hypothetical protein
MILSLIPLLEMLLNVQFQFLYQEKSNNINYL